MTHGPHAMLPQSSAGSSPLVTPSEHDGGWQQLLTSAGQAPAAQTPLWQSTSLLQLEPSAHERAQVSPQSTPASPPFCTPSLHDTSVHTRALLSQNARGPQSESEEQPSPGSQARSQPAPQSADGSFPLRTPSEQLGARGTGSPGGQSEPAHPAVPSGAVVQLPASHASPIGHATSSQHSTPAGHRSDSRGSGRASPRATSGSNSSAVSVQPPSGIAGKTSRTSPNHFEDTWKRYHMGAVSSRRDNCGGVERHQNAALSAERASPELPPD